MDRVSANQPEPSVVTVRFNPRKKELIQALAHHEWISMNQWIVRVVNAHLKDLGYDPDQYDDPA